jgi:hopene-associated glycosyltransferase HpnB
MLVLAALSLAIWIYLLAGHGYFWQAGPSLPPNQPPAPAPSVVVVVPARDEVGTIGRSLRSLLAQDYAGPYRVVLVDDGSQDGTGEVAAGFSDTRLTVLQGAERPVGWSGKLWALSQGINAAEDAEMLLLTDADIEHAPAHLATLVAKAMSGGLDMVSEMVALHCESLAERALVPAFVFFFALLYPFSWVNDAGNRVAAAAGGTVLIRATALRRIGGIAAMRGALIDDVTLAGLVKRQGRVFLGHSQLAASIRPYPGAGDVWRMVARTAFVQLRFSGALLAGTILGMVVVWAVPPVVAVLGHGAARWAAVLAWVAMGVAYVPTLRRFRLGLWWAPFLPLVAMFYTAATVGSAMDHWRGRGVVWKRRSYS